MPLIIRKKRSGPVWELTASKTNIRSVYRSFENNYIIFMVKTMEDGVYTYLLYADIVLHY